jgi:hypothetical protein
MLSEKCFLSKPQDKVKKRRVSIGSATQREEPEVALRQQSSRTRKITPKRATQSLEAEVFTMKHTTRSSGKRNHLISSLTFVIFVPFVVSHCSRTLRVGASRETIMH